MGTSLKTLFDNSLSIGHESGYKVEDGRIYDNYLNKDDWKSFKAKLENSNELYTFYKDGKGSELTEKKNRYGKYTPPKMASFASSSRFAVYSFTITLNNKFEILSQIENKEIHELKFEQGLPIKCKDGTILGGTPPQMDVTFIQNGKNFIEVKCHEIFDTNKIEFSTSYDKVNLFDEIISHSNYTRKILQKKRDGELINYYEITRAELGIETGTHHMDVAQFIRHLMGIISDPAENKNFYYLFYKNNNPKFEQVYDELEIEFATIKRQFKWLLDTYHINLNMLYNDQFDTIKTFTPVQ